MQPVTPCTAPPNGSARCFTAAGVLIILTLLASVGCRDETESPNVTDASSSPTLANVTATAALTFRQVSGGTVYTCGVTTDDRAYCWGQNTSGQLGDGTTADRSRPVAVAGSLHFRSISAGANHTCGVTTNDQAYCWGSDAEGELGNGQRVDHVSTPARVLGGLAFRQVSAGGGHTCGVTTADVPYCWGVNDFGQLGRSLGDPSNATAPVPVAGGLHFRNVAAGAWHTCGIGTDDQAYCWGRSTSGQIGDSANVAFRAAPSLVAGGRRYRELDVGTSTSCAVTTDHVGYCWGEGRAGQLGNGKTYLSYWPRRVAGGLSMRRISPGSAHACGETTDNRVYCWGRNDVGQLGNGTTGGTRLTPTLVAGGLFFGQANSGAAHTCARTPAGVAYCWGYNANGRLGDGTTTNRSKPTRVVSP